MGDCSSGYTVLKLVSWSLTSLFGTIMAISETNIPSSHVSGHSGQLSLLPSVGREMSADQAAVHCSVAAWEDNPRCGVAEGMRQSSQTLVTMARS